MLRAALRSGPPALALQNCATDTSMPKKSKDASSDVPPADLYWAARHGSELRIRAALDKGAAVDALFDGRPALVVAALSDQPHAVAALLEAGATVDLAEDGTSLTPLASAVIEGSLKCAERLADAGADLERADADGLTPLMHAALHGRADEAHLLLKRGASPDAKAGGVDARRLASVRGHDRVIWRSTPSSSAAPTRRRRRRRRRGGGRGGGARRRERRRPRRRRRTRRRRRRRRRSARRRSTRQRQRRSGCARRRRRLGGRRRRGSR